MDHTRISLGQCFPLYSFFTLDKIVHVILLVTSVYSVFINILFSFVNESKCRRDCVLTVISLHVSLIAYKCRYPKTIGRTKVRVHRIFWLTKKKTAAISINWLAELGIFSFLSSKCVKSTVLFIAVFIVYLC